MHDSPDDSLPLESIASADQIEDFRRRPHSMCRYCNNEALTVAPWERSSFAAEEWLADAQQDPEVFSVPPTTGQTNPH